MNKNFIKTIIENSGAERIITKVIDDILREPWSVILRTFFTILPIYPVGTRVRVTDSPRNELMGCYGVAADFRPDHMFTPTVILVESKIKKRLPKPLTFDFVKHKGFAIELA